MIGDILQPTHLLFVLIVALLVLGPKRLPEAGRAVGTVIRDFRMAMNGEEQDHGAIPTAMSAAPGAPPAAAPSPPEEATVTPSTPEPPAFAGEPAASAPEAAAATPESTESAPETGGPAASAPSAEATNQPAEPAQRVA